MRDNFLKLFMVAFLFQSSMMNSQAISKNELPSFDYEAMPQERVFIHFNTSLLFAGEYLYYSIYCIDSNTEVLSEFSKIAYVELIDEKLNSIFKHKIKLKKGTGQGDFFLPVSIPSGNYKLIGYTQWMNNESGNNFFQGDVSIINPYQGNQKSILSSTDTDVQTTFSDKNVKDDTLGEDLVKLLVNKETFTKRDKVSLTIKNTIRQSGYGSYSISVKKKDTIRVPVKYTSKSFKSQYKPKSKSIQNVIPPELRGELISGKITATEPGVLIANKKVSISIPGENYELKVATTNKEGLFYFNVDKDHNEQNAFIQVLGNSKKYRIELFDSKSPDYSNLTFNKFSLTRAMKSFIQERSVFNQIQNGYFSVKPDTLRLSQQKSRFYKNMAQVYDLDDYTRFPTIRETLVEVVNNAWIKKIGEEEYIFQVRGYDPATANFVFLPLVIIDGVIIQDHSSIVDYNANKIKRIRLIRDLYQLNSQMFQGVIDIETINGDYHKSVRGQGLYALQLSKPLPTKKYYRQRYDQTSNEVTNHIPDYRNQLFWKPNLQLDKDEIIIDFFTSDNKGDYEISLEGFTKKGDPVSIQKVISVQ